MARWGRLGAVLHLGGAAGRTSKNGTYLSPAMGPLATVLVSQVVMMGGAEGGQVHEQPRGFAEFVAARSAALVRTAWLLTGDESTAQDLVQTALAKTWTRWQRIERQEAPEAYVRRVMLTTYLTSRRRRWHGEVALGAVPDLPSVSDPFAEADMRSVVAAAMRELPRRQRAVLVLRYFDDLTEPQAARVLGCSVGTVKSQSSKALARLRNSTQLGELLSGEVSHEPH